MSAAENNARVYTIELIYKFYKAPTTNHYTDYGATVQNTPINIPQEQTFLNKFINKNTQLLQEFSNRGIGLLYLVNTLPPIAINKINTFNTFIRNRNELLVTIEFRADNGLQELMDDQSTRPRPINNTSNFYYQGQWWNDIFEKEIDAVTEEDKIKYIFYYLIFDDVEMFDMVLEAWALDFFIHHNNERYYYTGEVQNVSHKLLLDLQKRKQKRNIRLSKKITKKMMKDTRTTHNIASMLGTNKLSSSERAKEFQKALGKRRKKKTKKMKPRKKKKRYIRRSVNKKRN